MQMCVVYSTLCQHIHNIPIIYTTYQLCTRHSLFSNISTQHFMYTTFFGSEIFEVIHDTFSTQLYVHSKIWLNFAKYTAFLWNWEMAAQSQTLLPNLVKLVLWGHTSKVITWQKILTQNVNFVSKYTTMRGWRYIAVLEVSYFFVLNCHWNCWKMMYLICGKVEMCREPGF